ncbi:MAG: phosphoribosylanthranilate isomerase [Lachnospiraceae bacterium]|nr:phosphoribosylanthranilate isomerase [Lachnospiraceae bacterium]
MGCLLKICGLTREADALACNAYRPDYAGLVFWERSKRYVTVTQAVKLRSILDPSVKTVGVYVDPPIGEVVKAAQSGAIDIVQLHGQEDEDYIRELRKVCGLPIMKAFRISPETDFERINRSEADMILIDSGAGTGRTFDWEVLKKVKRPFFLAGGLSPDNAADAMRTGAWALDVSSGVETDGSKDPEKIRLMTEIVRNGHKADDVPEQERKI